VRVILREAPEPGRGVRRAALPAGASIGASRGRRHPQPRVTLIIGGGIAAFKSLDLIRG
jgi:phosphopantothenoylcysteine decarboxylase/phosphopantothenate--cysteine ligase